MASGLKNLTNRELMIAYKNKARCIHTQSKAQSIYKAIVQRMGNYPQLEVAVNHIQTGEGVKEFDELIDKIIETL